MTKVFPGLLLILVATASIAQKKKAASSPAMEGNSALTIPLKPGDWDFKPGMVEFAEYKSRPSMKILPNAGPVVLKKMDFTDGTIEFDHEPADPRFASMYFRWQDGKENECFYFRTQRAGNPTAIDAIQYAPHIAGVNLWDIMGHYQGNAVFQKQDWNHVKLVISGKQMRVYVNSETRPTLAIPRLEGNVTHGTIAFEGEAVISNLIVKPNQVEQLSPFEGIDPEDNDPRYIRHWQVNAPVEIPKNIDFSYDLMPVKETVWKPVVAERRGLINLTRLYGKSETRRIVWLQVNIKSETAQKRKIDFGFSDEVWIVINGRALYVDKNYYGQPIMKEPDGRLSIENTSFFVPLNPGNNQLLVGVGNDFYGWGIVARLDKMEGITIEKN